MGEGSRIEWTDHTFNPWIGCTKVSEACRHCYAETYADRYQIATWGPGGTRKRTAESTWAQPRKWSRQAKAEGVKRFVFCASLADIFEARDDLDPIRADLWRLIEECDGLTWLLLTKRPEEIRRRVPAAWLEPGGWPAHVWAGTSVEDQPAADTRIPHLLGVPAPVRFLSMEPLLGPVDLGKLWPMCWSHPARMTLAEARANGSAKLAPQKLAHRDARRIDWVIVGGESGPGARPMHPAWARSVRDQCAAAKVPFHFKQWGEWAPLNDGPDEQPDQRLGAIGDGRMRINPFRQTMGRIGKKAAGRLLDGAEHNERPEAT